MAEKAKEENKEEEEKSQYEQLIALKMCNSNDVTRRRRSIRDS